MAVWLTVLIVLTIGLPWIGAVIVLLVGDRRPAAQNQIAAGFAIAAGVTALILVASPSGAVLSFPVGGVFGEFSFKADGLGVFLAAIATVIGSLTVIFSADYMHGEKQLGRYYALTLLFIGAMVGLVLTNSLLLLLLFWEVVAFCSYGLISFHNDDPKAVAGGIKALVITQVGSLGLLIGVLAAVASLGNTQIDYFLLHSQRVPAALLGLIAFGFLAAAAAKSAQVPFHTWLPGAMEAPTPISALIHAATMVNAGVYLLVRFFPAFEPVPGWANSVIVIGVLSAVLAGFMALVSTDLKRVLAYSTISQLGYMFYAVGIGALFASQFHLLSHAVFKALLFLGAGAVIHTVGTRDLGRMGGLGRQMPYVRNVFIIGALALAGLPILNGFWSKELLLEAGLTHGPQWAYLAMLGGAGLTALYTLRVVWLVFYGEPRGAQVGHPAPSAMRLSLGVLAFGTLTTWLLAGPLGAMLALAESTHGQTTLDVISEIIGAPGTWVGVGVILLGLAAWQWRASLNWIVKPLNMVGTAAAEDFGFEWLNRELVKLVRALTTALSRTQTGQLNWNVAGIVMGLIVVAVFLMWKGTP